MSFYTIHDTNDQIVEAFRTYQEAWDAKTNVEGWTKEAHRIHAWGTACGHEDAIYVVDYQDYEDFWTIGAYGTWREAAIAAGVADYENQTDRHRIRKELL